MGGSSPLTRGKRRPPTNLVGGLRLIPAHAGKTTSARGDKIAGAAHPRSRGENAVMNHPAAAALGSSPLTRGKLTGQSYQFSHSRLIPAHAGKTCTPIRRLV